MYINPFLFGVMCTLFAEMALTILCYIIPTKRKSRNKHYKEVK